MSENHIERKRENDYYSHREHCVVRNRQGHLEVRHNFRDGTGSGSGRNQPERPRRLFF